MGEYACASKTFVGESFVIRKCLPLCVMCMFVVVVVMVLADCFRCLMQKVVMVVLMLLAGGLAWSSGVCETRAASSHTGQLLNSHTSQEQLVGKPRMLGNDTAPSPGRRRRCAGPRSPAGARWDCERRGQSTGSASAPGTPCPSTRTGARGRPWRGGRVAPGGGSTPHAVALLCRTAGGCGSLPIDPFTRQRPCHLSQRPKPLPSLLSPDHPHSTS